MFVLQALIDGLSLGALYALIAVGYTVVYGIIQLINFAHGEIFMIGAFGSVTVWLLVPGEVLSIWMLPLMLVGGMIASVAVALLMERIAYRPLRNAPRLAPLITAIGVSIFLQEFVRLFYGKIPGFPDAKANVGFPRIEGVTGQAIQIGGLQLDRPSIFTLSALIVCTGFLYLFINKTGIGRAMQATSQDPDTARLMGINVDKIIMIAFAVGAALAAVAGVAQGLKDTNIDFRMGFIAGLKAFSAAVLGGIGNIWGALVGGLVIGVFESLATAVMPSGSAWKDVWAFVVLILILVFRPQGLLGARVVDRA
ncbi:branched-chain amino acid ABC transporter permease [Microlunatus elymi]|uniref:Branched-chain amino acid ABC transporter permease n=1 Tax=Microlunatus elymi TaxID=2596828 RepID=A0A516Q2B1_9ACTN|nr:branched-chain amino acid ABC transporter permease [Microlunatus elymi]QDP97575.1 branched-chain amino acid ABC transporter permease [Microlunatus elymi]